jgi:hypothetical protein
MNRHKIRLALCLGISTAILAALGGCGKSSISAVVGAAQGMPFFHAAPQLDLSTLLPAPSGLLGLTAAKRRASFTDDDVLAMGKDFLPGGRNRATTGAMAATLTPDWQTGGLFSDVAYRIYHFTADNYDRLPIVRILTPSRLASASSNTTWTAI